MNAKYKVVFHIENDQMELLTITYNNIVNLIKHTGLDNVSVAIVANYTAPKLFVREKFERKIADSIYKLVEQGCVSVYICNNSLSNLEISPEELMDFCKITPAGIAKIIELQLNGFAYVKP